MASLILRTYLLVTLFILVNSISQIKCENEIARPQKHTMPLLDEHLLRSGEDRSGKSAEEEEITVKTKESISYEDSEQTPPYTTTVSPQATMEYPESVANDDEEEYADKKAEELTTPADVTDTTSPEDIQQITDRMDVYTKHKEVDGNNVAIDKETTTERTEQTLTTTSATEPKDFVPRTLLDDPEDHEVFGQRSPKTENSDQKPQIDKRNFDYPKLPADQPEASKSSILRAWIEDPWLRSPSAILVPLRPEALSRALAVWNDLMSIGGLNVSDIIIVGYDSKGVNWRSRHNLLRSHSEGTRTVSGALSKLLFKYKDVNTNQAAGDATMRALTSAAKLVPYDSALFVVTDKAPGDAQRLPLALRALVEKRLKVYTVWTDPHYPSTESDVALQEMRNISAHTEGDILPYSLQVMEMDNVDNLTTERDRWAPLEAPQPRTAKLSALVEDKLETLLVKRGGGDAISLGVPVETGVTGLRVYIEGAVEHAVIYPPNEGPQIDLYNQTSVESFFPGSRTDSVSPRDVYLVFPSARSDSDMLSVVPVQTSRPDEGAVSTAGVWHLSMRCDTCDYRLTICAHARIRFDTEQLADDMLSIRVLGPVATVRESILVDEYGTELSKLAFSYQPAAGEDDARIGDGDQELVAEVQLPEVKEPKVYVKIVGRDLHGESFVRLSGPLNKKTAEVRTGRSASIAFPETVNDLEMAEVFSQKQYDARGRYNETQVLPNNRAASQVVNTRGTLMTTVQIGLSSRLYGAPGDRLQLHFEVTNYREQAVYFRFEAIGELRFLRGISPASQTVASGQTANVIVTVGITASAQPGARDLITFTAYGLETVSIPSYVYVVNSDSVVSDIWAPSIRHDFQGTCIGRMGDDCAQNAWAATVVARDAVGGLLRLSSTPIGLLYNSNFISGTREEVTATYRATCCAPRVLVTAVDAYGNANSYVVDISNYFTPASVAAIVLGVFLLIALIAVLVLLIYWCAKRRKESRDMPSYATSSRRDIS